MNAGLASGPARTRRRPGGADEGGVPALTRARIERALERRVRYRYVRPRVEREGTGWKIVSPNCSRRIDASGGEIDIAWFVAANDGRWRLHSRDHRRGGWLLQAAGLSLEEALARVCADPLGEFWP